MFLSIDKIEENSIAAIDDTNTKITYGELCSFSESIKGKIPKRSLVFCLCENNIGSLAGYVAFQSNHIVPLLIGNNMDHQLFENLLTNYQPSHLWVPINNVHKYNMPIVLKNLGYALLDTGYSSVTINDKLSLLLTTSGSTGSPKLVRHKYGNLESNAKNVAMGLGITQKERPLIDLPMQYTMGLNVINSHLIVGSTLILTNHNILSADFWKVLREEKVTSFTGVPFSYELLFKLRFERMHLENLNTLIQGGGKLSNKQFTDLANYAEKTGKRFIATYGTTETSARISFLPSDKALVKCGSIGISFPEGEMYLIDENGKEIHGNGVTGQLAFRGPNVTMGYAECKDDLLLGDTWNGNYYTGDIAHRDNDGFYYIIGRLSRFLKLSGHRVSLDQCENLIKSKFDIECACSGTDSKMKIFITSKSLKTEVLSFISQKTGIYKSLFEVITLDSLPKNEVGKIMYKDLK